MKETIENLKVAFAGESQASQKYLAFAKKAEADGFRNVATLFQTAAQAERIHAAGHLGAMDGIGSTAENLAAAIEGETYEYTKMYPPMIKQAQADGHKAGRMFGYATKAEAVHAHLLQAGARGGQGGEGPGRNAGLPLPGLRTYRVRDATGQLPDLQGKGLELRSGEGVGGRAGKRGDGR